MFQEAKATDLREVAVQEGTGVLLVCVGGGSTSSLCDTACAANLRREVDARSHLINIWPASETMLPESIESHKRRENAAGSACLSQSNLLLPYL